MIVLQLIDTLDAGGAERMAVTIANALSQEGITSFLCATRRGGPLENDIDTTVKTLLLGKKSTFDIKAFRRFFVWVKEKEIEIIHAHATSIFLAVLTKFTNPKLRIIWHDHYGLIDGIEQRPTRMLKLIATHIDLVFAVTQRLADWSREVLKKEKVFFLHNFTALSHGTDKKTILKGVAGKHVVCLANLRPQKNHLELIEGFGKVTNRFPEWTLHLVGKSFEDNYSNTIQLAIRHHKLKGKVFLYGSRTDVAAILEQASIGVLTSVSEGLPVALLEYANSALPVIVSDVGQCAAVVGNDGIVLKNIKEELPDALMRLYENRDNEREVMGSRFCESVQKNYSKEAFMQKVLPIYKAMIS